MFAFVLYDSLSGELKSARDHFGQKPLYYFQDDEYFGIASSVRSLLELKNQYSPNFYTYRVYLCTNGKIHPEDTFFYGIRSLSASHILSFKDHSYQVEQYFKFWSLYDSKNIAQNLKNNTDSVFELKEYIQKAISRHIYSDIPIGVLLSGGIDSSLVYFFAHDYLDDLTVFTKISPGIEQIPKKIVPSLLNIKPAHWFMRLEKVENYLDNLAEFIMDFGEPLRWGKWSFRCLCFVVKLENLEFMYSLVVRD